MLQFPNWCPDPGSPNKRSHSLHSKKSTNHFQTINTGQTVIMPLFKKKNTDKEKAKRPNLIAKILDDNRELTDSLKEHTELCNTLRNQIEQMRHDEDIIQKLKPKLQGDLKILERGSKQLERDQKALEKTFDKLTTKVTPPELEEIHQAYHNTEPTAPLNDDDASSLPPYDKATSLYPSLSKPTPSFVIMDGIGQEEIAPVPSFVVETDEEENITTVRPKSVGPAGRTRSKQTKALKKAIPALTKNLQQLSTMLREVPRASDAASSSPFASSPFLQPTPPPKKTPPTEKPRPMLFDDSLPEDIDDLSSFSEPPTIVIPPRETN